ncbi:hypothetical protein Poli38472_001776 [Pythium oligandrum]|uniref:subtilisin n=1 Tax=Pythium oligandrum TaxID=41045 RepID=A0A8K1CVU6_PYTOL|nr:hypothetical protein Poli38472_001776 [Pythium oligandrum]|eukprot:TMW69620.1 hypothetical protein Poli38472_001776 [Pythium oligandrum]
MVFTKFAPLVLASALVASDASAAIVDPAIHRTLRQQGNVNLIVTMKKGTQEAISSVKEASFTTRGALIEDLVSRLQQHAEDSQVEVGALFAKEAAGEYTKAESYWISNQIFVEGATASFLERLSALPSVGEIREEEVYKVPEVFAAPMNSTAANEWGVEIIQAPAVWAAGNTGKGVIVGAIDTGVRGTHEAVKANFRGAYGWFDPEAKKADPYDNNGHGSHVMGTIAGANGVGVAPGATWMACKGCRTSSCPQSDLLACFQFMTCPTDPSGNNKDCSKAPHLVSNSWGGGQGSSTYKAAVDAWHKAGIIPVFANGNEGRTGCKTASSPGDYANVIAVGATNSTDGLADFSSKGPTVGGIMKPEISAPGVAVRSAWYTGDNAYNSISGTSMATPHVSGAIALLLAAKPGLTFDQVREALTKNVDTASLSLTGYSCGTTKDGVFPNNMYGYGRLNINKAVGGAPVPTPTSPAPTSPSPTTPAPTTKTPAPTTPAPTQTECSGNTFFKCILAPNCSWSWSQSKCLSTQ